MLARNASSRKKTINATLHLDAPQNFGSNQSKCRLGIASCSDFVATWQAACFDSRDECASAVLSKCQMTSKGDKYPFNPKNQSRRRIAANRLLLDRAGTKLFAMAGVQPMSGQSVLDETFRAKVGCSQLFREYCNTAVTSLHDAAGMSSANCSAALQLGLASATINVCSIPSFGFESVLRSDLGYSDPLQLQMGRCNESVQKWKFGCKHASIDACRDAAAALFPDRCDRDALAFDTKLLEQLTTENRLESILLALTGPSANFSTQWGAASRPANLNFLRGQLVELETRRKQAVLAAKPSQQTKIQSDIDRVKEALTAAEVAIQRKDLQSANLTMWVHKHSQQNRGFDPKAHSGGSTRLKKGGRSGVPTRGASGNSYNFSESPSRLRQRTHAQSKKRIGG
eukprot:INCI9292.1.p1 GENE.INCI9292.1~~INCI9292.1.p1  ORF type:complete len:399 (-),score=44.90 INCI9292.1:66-1262(-)